MDEYQRLQEALKTAKLRLTKNKEEELSIQAYLTNLRSRIIDLKRTTAVTQYRLKAYLTNNLEERS